MTRRHVVAMALMMALPLQNTAWPMRPALAAGEDRAMALDLFDQGRALFKSGSYAAALSRFEAAAKLMRTFGILLNIAECQEKLGRTASAWATWSEARVVAAEARRPDDERTAAERQKALEAGLSRLTIVVPPEAESPQLEVLRDDTEVPREGWARAIAVDPGPHVIEARAPGRKSRTFNVYVQPSADSRTVTLTPLDPEPGPAPPAPSASPAPVSVPQSAPATAPTASTSKAAPVATPAAPVTETAAAPVAIALPPAAPPPVATDGANPGSGQRVAGWVLAGLGVAAVGSGIGVAVVGQGQHNDAVATDLAGNVSQAQTMESKADTTKTIGYITIGAGGAFVLTGLVLVLAATGVPRVASAVSCTVPSGSLRPCLQVTPWASTTGGGAGLFAEW
jgi:hypothetical protein